MRNLIPPNQRAYLASHPLALWLSIGITFTGCINALFPSLNSASSASVLLPFWAVLLFNLTWAVGGAACAFGLLRGKSKVEGAGMCLLCAGLLSLFLAIISVRFSAALGSAAFILTLAVGCGMRARHLLTHTYVVLDVPKDQPGLRKE